METFISRYTAKNIENIEKEKKKQNEKEGTMRWARTQRTYLFIERGLRSMISIMYSISYIPLEKNRAFHFVPAPQT